ncbi:hypothetical protein V8G56_12000 [Gaetbulibacter aquiaggeris]|uniref:Lipoprotein n=1 Tax=Gaetbulibacter aquiaggeris TaxID=1735373 RepID=A0ABW7MRJ9_9FLAO
MKATLLFILIILFMACASPNGEIEIPILVFNKSINKLSPNVASHKDKDVEILSSDFENGSRIVYSCIIYRMDNGVLKGYQAHISFLNNYNKAKYEWVNDSTVTVSFNNKFSISEKHTIMGYGSTTLLHWDD